jgi:hypothetical protein
MTGEILNACFISMSSRFYCVFGDHVRLMRFPAVVEWWIPARARRSKPHGPARHRALGPRRLWRAFD